MWWKYLENLCWLNQLLPGCCLSSTWNSSTQIRLDFLTGREGQRRRQGEKAAERPLPFYGWSFLFFSPPSALSLLFLCHALSFLLPFSVYLPQTSEVIASRLLFLKPAVLRGRSLRIIYTQSSIPTHITRCTSSQQETDQFLHTVSILFFYSSVYDEAPKLVGGRLYGAQSQNLSISICSNWT